LVFVIDAPFVAWFFYLNRIQGVTMATAKPKGPVKVTIGANSAVKLEAALRKGLTGSPAHITDEPPEPKKRPKNTSVELDAPTVAKFADHLRDKLVGSGAYIFPDDDDDKKKK